MKQNSHAAGPPATNETSDLDRTAQVRLHPFLGISPGAYLTVIYGLAVVLILFLVLIYPALRSPGGQIEITATPRHVNVLLNGQFVGTTPLSVKVAPGTHELKLTRASFESVRLQVEVGERILGTLIVRKRIATHANLRLLDAASVARRAVAGFAGAWHATGIIEDAGHALARAEAAYQYEFLHDTLPFVDRRQALGALLRSATIAAAGDGPVTPYTMRRVFDRFVHLDRDYPGLPLWLASAVPDQLRERLITQRWHIEHGDRYRRGLAFRPTPSRPPTLPESVILQEMRFRIVPDGTLLMGDDVDRPLIAGVTNENQLHLRRVASFLMTETEVTNRQFARFVAEVPRWSPGATDQLVSDQLTETTYLASWTNGIPAPGTLDKPVTHVSHHAAVAFATWLSATLSDDIEWPYLGLVVRLPTEAEWEWAARGGLAGQPYPNGSRPDGARLAGSRIAGPGPVPASEPNGYGLHDLIGNVWEWTATWYAPASYLLWAGADPPPETAAGHPDAGAERVVRGGSWASERELIRVYSRGAQEPAWATPYLGFRVVLAPADTPDG